MQRASRAVPQLKQEGPGCVEESCGFRGILRRRGVWLRSVVLGSGGSGLLKKGGGNEVCFHERTSIMRDHLKTKGTLEKKGAEGGTR